MTLPEGMIIARSAPDRTAGGTIVLGLIIQGGRVVEIAPFGKRWKVEGMDAREAWRMLARRGWRLYWLPDDDLQPGGKEGDGDKEANEAADHEAEQEGEEDHHTSR